MSLLTPDEHKQIAHIVTRRHPLALSLYAMVFVLGLIFVFQWFGTDQRVDEVFPDIPLWVIFAWKWEMVTGGGGAFLALVTKPRITPHFPDLADLLHIEGIGAIVAAFGLGTYAYAVVVEQGVQHSGPAMAFFAPLVLGHVWRGAQALREGRMLERVAQIIDDDDDIMGMTNGSE